jgi:hypothetical protein
MAAKTTLSLEEFLKLPEAGDDGTHYELDEGERLITLTPAEPSIPSWLPISQPI